MVYYGQLVTGANLTNEEHPGSGLLFGFYNWIVIKNWYSNKLNSTTRSRMPMESFSVLRSPSGTAPLPVVLIFFHEQSPRETMYITGVGNLIGSKQ